MKIVALSDTHGHHRTVTVPMGDVLVFAGDLMTCGYKWADYNSFMQWFAAQPHNHKILVAGNHDRLIQRHRREVREDCKRYGLESTGQYVRSAERTY